MSVKESEKKCLTFIWKIENASYCIQRKEESIKSPVIEVDELGKTNWSLFLYPRGDVYGNNFSYFLKRENGSKTVTKIKIKREFAFLAKDGSELECSDMIENVFSEDEGFGWSKFVKGEDVFLARRSVYLPQDTLTVRCRIWKSVEEMSQDVCCIVRTRIGVEKRSFLWEIEKFSTLELEKQCTYLIKSLVSGSDLASLTLSVSAGQSREEIIRFEFIIKDQAIKFSTMNLFIVDVSGKRVQCNQDEFWFENIPKCKQFTFFFTRKQLMISKNMYLPNDILSLHWDLAFSKGIVLEEIEEVQKGYSRSDGIRSDAQKNYNQENVPFPHAFSDNLKSLYDENFLCDVKLKTSTNEYPAHKLVLSASSCVFKAMFSRDMKEKHSNYVDINDLNDDAVSGMLLYIYTGRVDDLTWERANHLYIAADKYSILNLKDLCSAYLKDNLSPRNACEVLLISDLHTDGDLKAFVQNYILKHIKDIIILDEWKLLMDAKAKLAAETLCLQYK